MVERSGLSRRDLIKGSVVAGGLVWAAPGLMSSPASAQTGCPCVGGVQTTVKIPSSPSANCGVSCLSSRANFNFPCLDDLVNCLFAAGYITFQEFMNGQIRKARIVLSGGIKLLATAIKTTNECVFAECPNYCPNTCVGGDCDPIPVTVIVCPGGNSGGSCPPDVDCQNTDPLKTEIVYTSHGQPINHLELALCVPNALTGQCP